MNLMATDEGPLSSDWRWVTDGKRAKQSDTKHRSVTNAREEECSDVSGATSGKQDTRVAFYGTLMRGFENHARTGVSDLAFLGECLIPGTLYDLGEFPGLKLDESHAGDDEFVTGGEHVREDKHVAGELYRCRVEEFDRFDRFEGSVGEDPLYVRESVGLVDPTVDAWVYEYAREVNERDRIDSGDWRAYAVSDRRE